jgi:hypothetical protein
MEPLLSISGELVLLAAKWKAAQKQTQANRKPTLDSSGLGKKKKKNLATKQTPRKDI